MHGFPDYLGGLGIINIYRHCNGIMAWDESNHTQASNGPEQEQ